KVAWDGSSLSLVYSTYLGGSDIDIGDAIAVDAGGSAYVTGVTNSTDFPVSPNPGAFQTTHAGDSGSFHAFVATLSPDGSSLVYSTYLGGSDDDDVFGIAVDASGSAYVTGYTFSIDFPTYKARYEANAGYSDAFVTKLAADGSSLAYSTYLG